MSKRVPQINQLLKREISQILLKDIEFPCDVLVTITRVETSSNLTESKIWVSVFPKERAAEVFEKLNRKIYSLQQKINKRLKMRPVPKIRFLEEKKTAEAGAVEEILNKLNLNE